MSGVRISLLSLDERLTSPAFLCSVVRNEADQKGSGGSVTVIL